MLSPKIISDFLGVGIVLMKSWFIMCRDVQLVVGDIHQGPG